MVENGGNVRIIRGNADLTPPLQIEVTLSNALSTSPPFAMLAQAISNTAATTIMMIVRGSSNRLRRLETPVAIESCTCSVGLQADLVMSG
jgi:hypothetical protein